MFKLINHYIRDLIDLHLNIVHLGSQFLGISSLKLKTILEENI